MTDDYYILFCDEAVTDLQNMILLAYYRCDFEPNVDKITFSNKIKKPLENTFTSLIVIYRDYSIHNNATQFKSPQILEISLPLQIKNSWFQFHSEFGKKNKSPNTYTLAYVSMSVFNGIATPIKQHVPYIFIAHG